MVVCMKHHLQVLIHPRWSKSYNILLQEMKDESRAERVDKLLEQHYWEQKFVADAFSKQEISTKNSKESKTLISSLKDKLTIYKEDLRITVPDHTKVVSVASTASAPVPIMQSS